MKRQHDRQQLCNVENEQRQKDQIEIEIHFCFRRKKAPNKIIKPYKMSIYANEVSKNENEIELLVCAIVERMCMNKPSKESEKQDMNRTSCIDLSSSL